MNSKIGGVDTPFEVKNCELLSDEIKLQISMSESILLPKYQILFLNSDNKTAIRHETHRNLHSRIDSLTD